MAVAPSFPLYKLPKEELRWVLRVMDPADLFKLSLLSKQSKDLVTSRNLRALRITILVSESIQIRCILTIDSGVICYLQTDNNPSKKIVNPSEICILHDPPWDQRRYQWKREGFEAMDWVNHFRTTFHQKEIAFSLSGDASQFDLDSLCQQFPAVPSRLGFKQSLNFDFNNRVFKMLAPKNVLFVSTEVFENITVLNNILVQNIDELSIDGSDGKLTLDALLCSNSKTIHSHVSGISPLDINKFLKLWRSGSNSRLEQLYFYLDPLRDLDGIMEGIPYQIVSEEQNEQRIFKSWDGKSETCEGNGMDIYRFDGTKATVCIVVGVTWTQLYFHVWHDHCIGSEVGV